MPDHNQRVRNAEGEIFALVRPARKFSPPTRARSLAENGDAKLAIQSLLVSGCILHDWISTFNRLMNDAVRLRFFEKLVVRIEFSPCLQCEPHERSWIVFQPIVSTGFLYAFVKRDKALRFSIRLGVLHTPAVGCQHCVRVPALAPESVAKATALQTLARLPRILEPRAASGLRRVHRRFPTIETILAPVPQWRT